ncbi:hypothetical protein SAMN04489740_0966 [Arthrobacter alpinus]|uniref:Uncharacterized protein n=1 Tax=Arthrobacter alpinus TaxID=656366 RepID=A0A1H5HA29_9MICC|nr:hypothetical protein [Arthrobacter alpinus]SEE24876.1 hypothetical protein SAMN04489740_0966 [Arthrobacter alpinus]
MAATGRMTPTLTYISNLGLVQMALGSFYSAEPNQPKKPLPDEFAFVEEILNLWSAYTRLPGLQAIYQDIDKFSLDLLLVPEDATERVKSSLAYLAILTDTEIPKEIPALRGSWMSLTWTLREALGGLLKLPSDRMGLLWESDLTHLAESLSVRVERCESFGNAAWSLLESNVAAERAEEAMRNAQIAAGVSSSARLTGSYDTFAADNEKSSSFFRWATILLVAAGVGTSVFLHLWLAEGMTPGLVNWPALLYPLVVSGGIFGVATYCARQAHLHRTLATWSKTISIQLQTFDGFISPMTDHAIRDELRTEFARRVFGPHPKLKGEPGVTAGSPAVDSILTRINRDSTA